MPVSIIDARQIDTLPDDAVLLDVRTDIEHAAQCLARTHHHIPLHQLDVEEFLRRHGIAPERPVCLLCQSGKRAALAADKFVRAGHAQVYVIESGIEGCKSCGVNLRSAKHDKGSLIPTPLSLERQVRTLAGLFVLLGSLAALFVDRHFAALPLAVGLGLIFAGLTDRCGMALLLARAPWNRNASK